MKISMTVYFILALSLVGMYSCKHSPDNTTSAKSFGEIAKQESTLPIRPGKPGERPFWNTYAKRFIYAPAFDYQVVNEATKYRYDILSESDSEIYSFVDQVPYAALSPVWAKIPVGYFYLSVIGISANGDSLGLAGEGKYYRASPFDPPNDGVYHEPAMPYDSSAKLALQRLMYKDYVSYWLAHKSPDPEFKLYRYPSKIMSALISGAVMYAELCPNSDSAKRARKVAIIVADYLLDISAPKGTPLAYFPPTYYGYPSLIGKSGSHMQPDNVMMVFPANTGIAYLNLFDLTKDKKYLIAAKHIAQTYLKRQLESGTWHLFVNNKTGKPIVKNLITPTKILRFLRRLKNDYQMKHLKTPIQKAFKWIMDNPVKTFNWQGQFEDVGPTPPYKDLNKFQVCYLAIYLYKHNKHLKLAEELTRFVEDQFVVWEKPRKVLNSENWLTPTAQEQYAYWAPVNASADNVIRLFVQAYKTTHKEIYLVKAKSLANSITMAQEINDGTYTTLLLKSPYSSENWINCTVITIKAMYNFGEYLKEYNLAVSGGEY